ncbi:MAG: alpha/beta fold hydrolase [Leptospiraceae bacterium]|nr:alpha/beta fold hydrolase [Leptospiraceae bacterium]MCB1315910.1 alpha/beta fold hydrolase [Leptospiraceae bacterium]
MITRRSDFISAGKRCAGFLYLPDQKKAGSVPPVVIMAHGFGAEMSFGLQSYIKEFVNNGLAVYAFDYRSFGESEGKPRQMVHPGRHNQDWQCAIAHVSHLTEVDTERVALWGTSLSGGHVLTQAARHLHIKAVVAQIPFVSGPGTIWYLGIGFALQAVWHGLLDILASLIGRVHRVPIVSDPWVFGCMNRPDSRPGYLAMIPKKHKGWKNSCPARVALLIPFYRPAGGVRKIRCPVLIIAANQDTLIPVKSLASTSESIEDCRLIRLDMGHFDPYHGKTLQRMLELEVDFLTQHLEKTR